MHNNICTWVASRTAAEVTMAANDFYYEDVGYDDFPCLSCFEDRDWCRCDEEN